MEVLRESLVLGSLMSGPLEGLFKWAAKGPLTLILKHSLHFDVTPQYV